MTPKTKITYLWKPQDTLKNSKKSPIISKHIIWESQNVEHRKLWTTSKRRTPTNPDDPSNQFLKILDMGSIASRKHEMTCWLYGIIETLKLRNQETQQNTKNTKRNTKQTNSPINQQTNKPTKQTNNKTNKPRSQGTNKPRNLSSYPSTYRLPLLQNAASAIAKIIHICIFVPSDIIQCLWHW